MCLTDDVPTFMFSAKIMPPINQIGVILSSPPPGIYLKMPHDSLIASRMYTPCSYDVGNNAPKPMKKKPFVRRGTRHNVYTISQCG